jgi:hypothetical protein
MRDENPAHTAHIRRPYRMRRMYTRDRLAFLFGIIFAAVCLVMLFAPIAQVERLVPFVLPPITLILNHYFGRRNQQ